MQDSAVLRGGGTLLPVTRNLALIADAVVAGMVARDGGLTGVMPPIYVAGASSGGMVDWFPSVETDPSIPDGGLKGKGTSAQHHKRLQVMSVAHDENRVCCPSERQLSAEISRTLKNRINSKLFPLLNYKSSDEFL